MNAQPELDFTATHYRKTDPATSAIAASRAKKFAGGQTAKIIAYLRLCADGATIEQIAEGTGLNAVQVARRSKEMREAGAYTRGVRQLLSGNPGQVWFVN